MWKFLRRVLTYGLIILIVGGLLLGVRQYWQNNRENLQEQNVEILDETTVERDTLRVTVGATGAITPNRQLPLVFEVPGIVAEVLVEVGDVVHTGDVLARLDTADLETARDSAQVALDTQLIAFDALTAPPRDADIAAAQAAVDVAQAALYAAYSTAPSDEQVEIARLQAELSRNQLWQAQLQRDLSAASAGASLIDISGLIPDDVDIPPETIDQVNQTLSGLLPQQTGSTGNPQGALNQAEYGVEISDSQYNATAGRGANAGSIASAQAALSSAQAALDQLINGANDTQLAMAEINIRQAELAVEQAQSAIVRAQIVAPFDGIVAQVNISAGEPPPTTGLTAPILLVNTDQMLLDVAIDETDIADIEVGQTVQLRFDALPDAEIVGEVTRIDPAPIIAGQLVTYPVRVVLEATDEPVRLGMSATATIIIDELQDVLVLPNRFIRIDRSTQQAYVTVERGEGQYEEIPVELGLRNETQTQILNGIEEGDRVVLLPREAFNPIAQSTGR
jgi:HlyD family secretion protein